MSHVILVFNFQTNGTAMKLIGNGCYIYNKTIKERGLIARDSHIIYTDS